MRLSLKSWQASMVLLAVIGAGLSIADGTLTPATSSMSSTPRAAPDSQICRDVNEQGESAISACTRIIQGKATGHALADAYYTRGQKHSFNGSVDQAIADFSTATGAGHIPREDMCMPESGISRAHLKIRRPRSAWRQPPSPTWAEPATFSLRDPWIRPSSTSRKLCASIRNTFTHSSLVATLISEGETLKRRRTTTGRRLRLAHETGRPWKERGKA